MCSICYTCIIPAFLFIYLLLSKWCWIWNALSCDLYGYECQNQSSLQQFDIIMDKCSVPVVCTLQITLNNMGLGGRALTNISYTLLTLLFFAYMMYLFNQNYVDLPQVFFLLYSMKLYCKSNYFMNNLCKSKKIK